MSKKEDFDKLRNLLVRYRCSVGKVDVNDILKAIIEIEANNYSNIDVVIADKIIEQEMLGEKRKKDKDNMYTSEEITEMDRPFRNAYKLSLLNVSKMIITVVRESEFLILIHRDAYNKIRSVFLSEYEEQSDGGLRLYRLPLVPEYTHEILRKNGTLNKDSDESIFDRNFHSGIIGMHCVVNKILNEYTEVLTTTVRVEISPQKISKNSKKKNKKKEYVRYINISTGKIKAIREENMAEISENKREYERHTEEWTRAGHYRHYKNGNVIWVKPSKMKAKKEIIDKKPITYKLV